MMYHALETLLVTPFFSMEPCSRFQWGRQVHEQVHHAIRHRYKSGVAQMVSSWEENLCTDLPKLSAHKDRWLSTRKCSPSDLTAKNYRSGSDCVAPSWVTEEVPTTCADICMFPSGGLQYISRARWIQRNSNACGQSRMNFTTTMREY